MKNFFSSSVKIIKNFIKNNLPITLIIIIAFILQLMSLIKLGYNYSLHSDDLSYIVSGITFFKTGKITMHGVISAQIMPGMTYIIALFARVFGTGSKFLISLKLFWMAIGLSIIVVIYKTLRLYTTKFISCIPCLFMLSIDYIWMNNLILTETPYILLFSLLIYYTLRFSLKKNKKDYLLIIVIYILALFIRPNIGIFPIGLVILLLLMKYNLKLLVKQCLIAGIILVIVLTPWAYRNYRIFNKFIPLTYGTGNPLLLGTYQGSGYPSDEELDYLKNVDEKMPKKMRYYINNPEKKDYLTRYYLLEYDGIKAKYRMNEWWKKDKISMIKSYCVEKPKILFYNSFYWDELFGININSILLIRRIEIVLFALSSILILIDKKKIKEFLFLIITYMLQIAIYSYTFAFSRYAISMFFIRYIIIGIGLDIALKKLFKWRLKDESINNNSSI